MLSKPATSMYNQKKNESWRCKILCVRLHVCDLRGWVCTLYNMQSVTTPEAINKWPSVQLNSFFLEMLTSEPECYWGQDLRGRKYAIEILNCLVLIYLYYIYYRRPEPFVCGWTNGKRMWPLNLRLEYVDSIDVWSWLGKFAKVVSLYVAFF